MVRPGQADDDAVVRAARAGDRDARDELARRHLPMVYHLVRQVLHDEAEVDDVVQDVMVRALRQLGDLRSPGSFRAWLTTVAVHQIGTHRARASLAARRSAPLTEAAGRPDAGAEVEGPALLRAALTQQRRQVRQAARWMGPDERTAFSLWWLELIGELTRAEVAAALGVGVAHAGVRIQRSREQLELSRAIVAALEALPGCDVLGDVVADWDGAPSPYWRKRIGRHVRSCPVCARAAGELVPADRLLPTLALLPVPIALAAAVLAKTAGGGAAVMASPAATVSGVSKWASGAVHAATAHPLAAVVGAGFLAVGVTVPATGWATAPQPVPAVAVVPRPGPVVPLPGSSARPPVIGPVSLESAGLAGSYVTVAGDQGVLAAVGPSSAPADRQQATLRAVAGLADPACVSLRGPDGRYLRHSSFRLRLSPEEGTVLFRRDATFCGRAGFVAGSVSLESFNYRTFFLRRVGDELWIDQFDGSDTRADGSFFVRPPLA
ncbi:sigma-70 family RNA polymerase sigma factor [Actinoplanes sp. M2I2]|uniref:sigma-70 family RNA polymerase sigma factor n=1 Tax=Actinoplanes sp. M2I2 TaxID=1734444 RepID=UPI00202290DD|nr:sigma-70 family RNA polymerase sigma factor [Actinoplanes sp. M2I2]